MSSAPCQVRTPLPVKTGSANLPFSQSGDGANSPPEKNFLSKVCEDCFDLYRDTDIYGACRYYQKQKQKTKPKQR